MCEVDEHQVHAGQSIHITKRCLPARNRVLDLRRRNGSACHE
jgi:hypothetical protein